MSRHFDKNDIEALLLFKTMEQLDVEELKFLERELGGISQVRAYRVMLLRSRQFLDVDKTDELILPASIKANIRAKMKHREPQKDGFDVMLASLLSLLPLGKQAVRIGVGAILVFLLGFSTTHYNGSLMKGTNALADSLSTQLGNQPLRMLADSSSRNLPLFRRLEFGF